MIDANVLEQHVGERQMLRVGMCDNCVPKSLVPGDCLRVHTACMAICAVCGAYTDNTPDRIEEFAGYGLALVLVAEPEECNDDPDHCQNFVMDVEEVY